MIGKLYKSWTPFYDNKTQKVSFKSRPCLIIAQADSEDYVILPISKITHKQNVDPIYDIPIDPAIYPKTNLTDFSYVRTHKQTTAHRKYLKDGFSDLKAEYEELYLDILDKREQFSKNITNQALK